MKRALLILMLMLMLMLMLSACARPPEPLWTEPPAVGPLLEILHSRMGQTVSLDADASVSITREGSHFSSQQFVLVQQPDQLRVDALTGFGQLLMQLATDGELLTVFMNTTTPPRFFSGSSSQDNFSRFIRLPLAAGILVPMMLYDPPVLRYQEAQVQAFDQQLVLILSDEVVRQSFYFDQQLQLTGSDYEQGGEPILIVRYSRFSAADNFPRRIELQMPQEDVVLAMRIRDLTLNAEIPASKFRLQAPVDIPIEPIP